MTRSSKRNLLLIVAPVALAAACSAAGGSSFTNSSGNPGGAGTTGTGVGLSGTNGGGGMISITIGTGVSNGGSSSTGQASNCTVTDPSVDMDGDGWTPNDGDCDDCDPNVNPGAIDVLHVPDAGAPFWGNEACDGNKGAKPCDGSLALTDTSADDGARAIELCQFTQESPALPMKTWGVISAAYVHADGTTMSPGKQVGIQSAWGSHVHVQGGARMLVISSGHARLPGQSGECDSVDCQTSSNDNPPPGYPLDNPDCPVTPNINDDVGLQLKIRAPTNATGYSFSFKFYSFEFPFYVCDSYNDQFVALVSPPPMGALVPSGSTFGDISFDSQHHPVSVNLGFFDVCDPHDKVEYANDCQGNNGCFGGPCPACPSPPNPYCPSGTNELLGTGFDSWNPGIGGISAGATSWLTSQAPVKGGQELTIRFAMWDSGDQDFDSTTLIDNFQWIANGSDVTVVTNPIPMPQ